MPMGVAPSPFSTRSGSVGCSIHASWLNQVEVYFSLVQRKVLTPNDYPDLESLRVRLALYEDSRRMSRRLDKPRHQL